MNGEKKEFSATTESGEPLNAENLLRGLDLKLEAYDRGILSEMLYFVNGHWVLLEQGSGKAENCTHAQLMQLISGVKNDAYTTTTSHDALIKNASAIVDGQSGGITLSDLAIRTSATHTPGNNSL